MILPHCAYKNKLPIEQVLQQILDNPSQEICLAISKLFFVVKFNEMSGDEQVAIHETYDRYFSSLVAQLSQHIGEPRFCGYKRCGRKNNPAW